MIGRLCIQSFSSSKIVFEHRYRKCVGTRRRLQVNRRPEMDSSPSAWNYCLISSEEQAHMRLELRHILNNAPSRADFEMLIQRKTELYPHNRRLFMGLEVAESAGGLHVNVVSTDLDRMS